MRNHRRHVNVRTAAAAVLRRSRVPVAALLSVLILPVTTHAQDALWVGRIGSDTVVVEASRVQGSRITGTIVNVAAGMLLQRYEVDLDERGMVRSFRSWTVQDLMAGIPPGTPPAVSLEIGEDSIRLTRQGRDGPTESAIAAVEGAVPIFDAFFNNPMALMDLALRQAVRRGDGVLRLYHVGRPQVDELPLTVQGTALAFPYVMAEQYPMLAGARLRATMDAEGLVSFDARETTFKIVTERRPWADPIPLARSFQERGLGTGGMSTLSPARRATGRVGSVDVTVTYGQPSRRGRRIFPDVVPFGQVWRAGANAATQITFSGDVALGGHRVPAGSYSLWVIPGERSDTVVLNKATQIWGVMYDAEQDFVRLPLDRAALDESVESLTYTIIERDGIGRLELTWDDRRFGITIEPAQGGAVHRSSLLRQAVADLDRFDQIRIGSGGSRLEGLFLDADPLGLSMRMDSDTRTLSLQEVDTLWVRGRATVRGSIIGGAIAGVGAGLLLGALDQGLCDAADCSGKFLEGFAIGFVAGTPPGVLLGAIAGAFIPRWHRKFP